MQQKTLTDIAKDPFAAGIEVARLRAENGGKMHARLDALSRFAKSNYTQEQMKMYLRGQEQGKITYG